MAIMAMTTRSSMSVNPTNLVNGVADQTGSTAKFGPRECQLVLAIAERFGFIALAGSSWTRTRFRGLEMPFRRWRFELIERRRFPNTKIAQLNSARFLPVY